MKERHLQTEKFLHFLTIYFYFSYNLNFKIFSPLVKSIAFKRDRRLGITEGNEKLNTVEKGRESRNIVKVKS